MKKKTKTKKQTQIQFVSLQGVGEFKRSWGLDETSKRVQRAKPMEAPNFPCFSRHIHVVDYMQNLYPNWM
jgi:hypothetical protein